MSEPQPAKQLQLGRAVVQGVVAGVVAAAIFYLAYQAILRTLFREVEDATGGGGPSVTGNEGEGGGGPSPGGGSPGLGGEFGGSGNTE